MQKTGSDFWHKSKIPAIFTNYGKRPTGPRAISFEVKPIFFNHDSE